MKIVKKVVLDKNEIALIKASLLLRGETYRSWCKKCLGNDDIKTMSPMTNIIMTGVITKKIYDRYLKPLNLPFFKDFKWEEEAHPAITNLDDLEVD